MKRIIYLGSIFAVIALAMAAAGAQSASVPAQSASTPAQNTSTSASTTVQTTSVQSHPMSVASTQDSSQGQDQPLGDYARKIHKTTTAKSSDKVFDNDNLPMDDKISVVGQSSDQSNAASDPNAKPADAKDPKSTNEEAKKQAEWKQWHEKVAAQKDQIDLDGRELDVLQKEYQLRAAAMYGDAGNRLRNSAEWDKEDAQYKQQIADKQKSLEDAKQKLDDMQEQARKAGVPSSEVE